MPSQLTYKPDTDHNGTLHFHRVLSVLFLTSCAYYGNGTHAAYTYDAADRLVSAVGTGLSLSMTYSPAGRIGTKIQTSSGTYNTNTNRVYAYCNDRQPHAVRRVWSINDKVWHVFIYDANGNLAQHTRWGGNNDGTRSLYWTEDSRMYASVDEGYVSLYGYDPSGERYSKIVGQSNVMDINAMERSVSAIANEVTLYPSPYIVASRYGYTKHIYAGADRICTKIGKGGLNHLTNLTPDSLLINARGLQKRQLEEMPGRRIEAAPVSCNQKIDGTSGSDLNCCQIDKKIVQTEVFFEYKQFHNTMTALLTDLGIENERYFYHPDHLGSASWITTLSGQPIEHLQYLPYGEARVDQRAGIYHERYTFTGKEKDSETGYYYFGARYYNPDLSLWLSVDPMADKYPSLSPYNYCAWNPMKLVDPDGCKIWLPSGAEYSPQMKTTGLGADDITTINALNKICNSEEGLLMLSEMCNHTNDVNISLSSISTTNQATGPKEAFYNARDNKPGTGMGITVDIDWNQSNLEKIPTIQGMQSDATYNLLDEICHAYDYCTGYGTNSKFNTDCDKGEFQAVYRSNLVRSQLGDNNYRSQYYVTQDGKSGSGPRTAGNGEFYRPSWYPQAKTDKISIPSDF